MQTGCSGFTFQPEFFSVFCLSSLFVLNTSILRLLIVNPWKFSALLLSMAEAEAGGMNFKDL
jgi:hypothetical protein